MIRADRHQRGAKSYQNTLYWYYKFLEKQTHRCHRRTGSYQSSWSWQILGILTHPHHRIIGPYCTKITGSGTYYVIKTATSPAKSCGPGQNIALQIRLVLRNCSSHLDTTTTSPTLRTCNAPIITAKAMPVSDNDQHESYIKMAVFKSKP